ERVSLRSDQREVLSATQHESADRSHPRLLHRLEQEHVKTPLRRRLRGSEVIGAVEVDRIDLVEGNEPRDIDRAGIVVLLDRLEVGILDHHELALRDLPALHDLVGPDLALVRRAPALLADRSLALAMKRAEADGPLTRLAPRCEG